MADPITQVTLRIKRGTSVEWAASPYVLASGEPGYDTTVKRLKVGDGVNQWSQLKWQDVDPATLARIDNVADAIEGATTPTDGVMAAVAADPASAFSGQLSSAIADVVNAYLEAAGVSLTGADIIIAAGQSNMSGRGTPYSSETDPINPRIFQYKSKAPDANTIVPATEPLDMHDTPSGIGPALQFARHYEAELLIPGRTVLIVPVAHGGTPLSSNAVLAWRRGGNAGNLYANMRSQALGALSAAGPGSRIVAALWIQGETDGDNGVTDGQYRADFEAMINGLRNDLSLPKLPFIIGTMVPEYLGTGTRAQINGIHRSTPLRIANTDVAVSAVGMNKGDGNHFSGPGQRYNGQVMFDAYKRVRANETPYSEPYTLVNPLIDPPGQVTGVAAGTVTSTSVPLSWTAVAGATSYLVQYRAAGSTSWIDGVTSSASPATQTALTPATDYQLRVVAVNAGGEGTPSAIVNATTATSAPFVPITDSFNRADNSSTLGTTATGQTWEYPTPNAGAWGIIGNAAYCASGSSGSIVVVEAGISDVIVKATFKTLSGANVHSRLVARASSGTSNIIAQLRMVNGVPGKYQLYKQVGGAFTQIGSDSVAAGAAGDVVELVAKGSALSIVVNGATVVSGTDAFNSTVTKHGLGSVNPGTVVTYDDFSINAAP